MKREGVWYEAMVSVLQEVRYRGEVNVVIAIRCEEETTVLLVQKHVAGSIIQLQQAHGIPFVVKDFDFRGMFIAFHGRGIMLARKEEDVLVRALHIALISSAYR